MRVHKYNGHDTRMILSAMITDNVVCSKIAALKPNGERLFRNDWAELIAGWCVNHVNKFEEAPNGHIQDYFAKFAETSRDKPTVESVERFLSYMSDEHERHPNKSADYILDSARDLFNTNRLRNVLEDVTDNLDSGDWKKAQDAMLSTKTVEVGQESMIILDKDFSAWRKAEDSDRRGIVTYPSEMGQFFGDNLGRDTLFSFMGVDKSGKSFWLLDLAYRAIRQRRNVAYFEAGDMGEEETIMRLAQRITGCPERAGEVQIPVDFDDDKKPVHETRDAEGVSTKKAWNRLNKVTRGRGSWRLMCYPNSSLAVHQISHQLTDWARDGWVADVVVIDYADILAPPVGHYDTLDQIDENWKQLRRLSQEHHCLVMTATQTAATAYDREGVLTRKHFSGRKTKLAHVNGMIGLNVSPEDKDNGITRLNWIVCRRGRWSERTQVHVAGALAVGRPAILSRW